MFRSSIRSKLMAAVTVPVVAAATLFGTAQVAFGTSSPSAVPVVKSFKASKTTLTDSGGKVVLSADLKYAKTCSMTVSPGLKGWPRSFSCSSDLVTETVVLAANKTENPLSYTFGLTVKNKAGTVTATNVVVSEGAAPPPISFTTPNGSSTTLVFAREGVFVADDPLIVRVHNNSSTTQLITTVAVGTVGDPTDFLLNRNNCSYITAHETCSLAVQFQPSGAGLRTGVVDVTDSSWGTGGATAVLKLEGIGVWATATVGNANISGGTLAFPTPSGVGSSSPEQFITLYNSGSVPLYVDGISDTGGEATDFQVEAGSCLNPLTGGFPLIVGLAQSCTFGVTFAPSASGPRGSNIVVDDNTLGTQTQLPVTGTGAYSTTSLQVNGDTAAPSPISYNFTPTTPATVGIAVTASLTVNNTSTVALAFNNVTVSGLNPGDFSVVDSPACGQAGARLAPGQSCEMTLVFDALINGLRQATVNVADNSPDGGEVIAVFGTAG